MTFQFELEHENPPRPNSTTHSSLQSLKEVIAFATNDKVAPHHWSTGKKPFVVFSGVALIRVDVKNRSFFYYGSQVMSSTIGSSIAAGASHQFAAYFDITSQSQLVLPTSSYLVGYMPWVRCYLDY